MALTTEEKAAVDTMMASNPAIATLAQQIGIENLIAYLREKHSDRTAQTSIAALTGDVRMTVADWGKIDTFLADAAVPSSALMQVLNRIQAKLAAHDAAGLGPLFMALYACEAALRDLTPPPA